MQDFSEGGLSPSFPYRRLSRRYRQQDPKEGRASKWIRGLGPVFLSSTPPLKY